MPPKNRMQGVEVVHRPKPRKARAEVRPLDPEQIRREVSPLADLLPSQGARDGEVLPPRRGALPTPAILRTRANFAEAISVAWGEAEESFTLIGRHLNHAKSVLDHGEFMAMVASDLPFKYSTANRLMKVAAALDAGILPLDRLPPSYATVYELLTLSEDERRRAIEEGVVRREMQRKDVAEFRRRLRGPPTNRLAELEAERDRLTKRLRDVERELNALSDSLADER